MPRLPFARLACLLFLVVGLFGCDHATKFAAKATLEGNSAMPVAPNVLRGAVELKYVENDDMAFNALRMLNIPRSPAILIGLSAVAIVLIAAMAITSRRRRKKERAQSERAQTEGSPTPRPSENANSAPNGGMDRATQAGLALILGGALGNIVDRIVRGYVVDFIHVKGWPVFNVADIAVVAGMILLTLPRLRRRKRIDINEA